MIRRLGGAVVVALIALLWSATPAAAHNSLIGSTPTNGAQVDAGPDKVELTFDQPVQFGQGLNTVSVLGPANDHWEAGPPQVASNVVTAAVRPLGPAGVYKIGFRILSADGHPVNGEVAFTLTKAGTGTPGPAIQPGEATPASGDSGGGVPAWVWIAGAAVLLAAGLTLALRMGKAPEKE